MGNNNIISSSKKEIYSKMLEIASKYTKETDADFLKTGLFGYMTESMAMMMRDSTFHKSMLYNESFLNTAIIPKSVYNWAKMFNIEVQKATPSYADIDIQISAPALEGFMRSSSIAYPEERDKFGIPEGLTNYIILDRECPIIAGDYYFSLERSILIKKNDKTNIYTAQYLGTERTATNFGNLASYNLIVKNNGENIIIRARAYQYKQTVYNEQIASDTFLNKVRRYTFDDQFCGAKLFYIEGNGAKVEVNLKYTDLSNSMTTQKIGFYNLSDENELELIFKTGSQYYMPTANSRIMLYVYTTKGANVVRKFSGTALMILNDDDMKALPITITFADSAIVGGKNMPSISEIKQTIINEISTRNVITTTADLNNYFMILTQLIEDVNDGKVTFVKKRDDVIKRIFNSYLLLRDNTDDATDTVAANNYLAACVPTNTINVSFDPSSNDYNDYDDNDDNDYFGRGNIINEPNAINNLDFSAVKLPYPKFDINGNYIPNVETNKSNYYVSPFYIYAVTKPIKMVKYIYNMTNDSAGLIYDSDSENKEVEDINNNITDNSGDVYYIIPTSISVERSFKDGTSAEAADSYLFTITTNTNFALGGNNDNSNKETFALDGGSLVLTSKEDASRESFIIYYSDIVCSSEQTTDESSFVTTFQFNLKVNQGNEFKIIADDNAVSNYDYCNYIYFDDNKYLPQDNTFLLDFTKLTMNNMELKYKFKANKQIRLFTNLDELMESDLLIDYGPGDGEHENPLIYGLTEVPVVHSSFFTTEKENRKKGFVTQLFRYIDILEENLDRLETTTFFNLKFYNTYGYSKLYETPRTNVELLLNISLIPEYKDYVDLKTEIRSYIRKIVDRMNNDEAGIKISTITSMLTSANTYGKYIDHIDFVGLNGSFNQYIEPVSSEESTMLSMMNPPEWLNLNIDTLEENIKFS